MRLEVLHVPDCPNLPPMLERLAAVTDLPVTTRLIETDDDAARFGMAGSPTLLIDGVDPFTAAGACECGVSCRLYRSAGCSPAAKWPSRSTSLKWRRWLRLVLRVHLDWAGAKKLVSSWLTRSASS
jgi:hypothetical protein